MKIRNIQIRNNCRLLLRGCLAGSLVLMFAGCGTPPSSQQMGSDSQQKEWMESSSKMKKKDASSMKAMMDPMPLDSAVLKAAEMVFSKAPKSGQFPQLVVVDPLIDGVAGGESQATQSIEERIVDLLEQKFPQFAVRPFTASHLDHSPMVLIGTFTGVNKAGKPVGDREAYSFYLTLLDMRSGKVASKAWVMVDRQGVDITPTRFYRDSPAWMRDPAVQAYIDSCHGSKVGDPINPAYLERLKAAALVSEAVDYYDQGEYRQARDLYRKASQASGGDQLRVYNGLYLTNTKLGQHGEAAQAFEELVGVSLDRDRLAVKFLFRPGAAALDSGKPETRDYGMWLEKIAQGVSSREGCLEIEGHASKTGPEPLNERLSLRRAEYVMKRLEQVAADLTGRTLAVGKGSQETLVGSGTDDIWDALDRRVEFDVIACNTETTEELLPSHSPDPVPMGSGW